MITTGDGDYDLHGDDLCVPSPGQNKVVASPRDDGTSSGACEHLPPRKENQKQQIASAPSSLNNSALLALEDTNDARPQPDNNPASASASSPESLGIDTDNPLTACLDATPSLLADNNGQYIVGTALDALVVAPAALLSGNDDNAAKDDALPSNRERIRPTVATSDFVVQFPADQVTDRIMAFLVTSTRTSLVGGILNGQANTVENSATSLAASPSSPPSKLKGAAKRSSRKLIRSLSNAAGGGDGGNAVPRGPSVQFWLNGTRIPDLEMSYANFQNANGSSNDGPAPPATSNGGGSGTTQCRFRNGNSTRPSSETMERLVREGNMREGVNTVELRLVLPIGGHGGIIVENEGTGGDAESAMDGGIHLVGGVVLAIAPALLHLWSSADSVIVSDIDGTVTKSDMRGVLDTVVTERFEHVHGGVCDLYQKLSRVDIASFDKRSDANGDSIESSRNDAIYEPDTDKGQVRFLYLSSRPLSLVNSTRRFLRCLVQGVNTAGDKMHRRMLPPGPLFCHPGSLSTVLLTELWNKNTHQFKADVLTRQVVLPFAAAGRDCYATEEDDANEQNEDDTTFCTPSSGGQRKLFLAGFGNKAMDAAAYEMAGMEKKDIYIINKESSLVCMDGDDEIDIGDSSRSPSISFGSGSTRRLLRKSVRRVKSAGSFRISQTNGNGVPKTTGEDQAARASTRAVPVSGREAVTIASAPTSLNGAHHTIPEEEEDECDMISGQLSATVESMLYGATDGVCCGSGGDNVDGSETEQYSASMTFGANTNYPDNRSTGRENGDGVDQIRSTPPSPPTENTKSPQRSPSLRHSASSPLARQSSTLSSKSSYRRYKGKTFTGYDDNQLFESIRWKIMDS
mmetsp:Transcript_3887/g.11011  ORF Transcript_3887/g.11011 Transcript_3887/m.11011 type:complete len:857 (-) Transcript_3887:69-2639(-)